VDASLSGIKVHMTRNDFQTVLHCLDLPSGSAHTGGQKDILRRISLVTWHMHFSEGGSLTCVPRNVVYDHKKQRVDIGFQYIFKSSTDERLAVAVAFGDSARLQRNVDYRHGGKSVPAAFWYLIRLGFHYGSLHIVYLIRNMLGRGWRVSTRFLTKEIW
jgi:cellulose synthase (UDP-forming)